MASTTEIVSGHSPIHLNKDGENEAHMLADHVGLHGGLHVIVSSDLPRATDTAKIFQDKLKVPLLHHPGLQPWKIGSLEGKTEADAAPTLQHHVENADIPVPGKGEESGQAGESFNEWKTRVHHTMKNLHHLAQSHTGSRIGAVTHSRTIHLIRALKPNGSVDKENFLKGSTTTDHLFHAPESGGIANIAKGDHLPEGVILIRHTATADDQA